MTKAKPTKAKLNRLSASPSPAQRPNKIISPSAGLDRLYAAAQQVGIECLDTEWRGKDARYRLRCAHGHEFLRDPSTLSNKGVICPECRDNARLARIQAAAAQRGGRCLETRYLGKSARYRFVCAKGHQWAALPGSIVHAGTWCRGCITKQHDNGLELIQAAAQARGGSCLASVYAGMTALYVFRCAEGHEWEAVGRAIRYNWSWCALCVKARKSATLAKKNQPIKTPPARSKSKHQSNLVVLRKGLGLNQHDFWSALGVTQSGGSRYECGRRVPKSIAILLDLLYVRGIDVIKLKSEDMAILQFIEESQPDLYTALLKGMRDDALYRKQKP